MSRTKTTKTEKLLNEIEKKGGMTPQEARAFVLSLQPYVGKKYAKDELRYRANGYYNAQLFGTNQREGLVGRFLKQKTDGTLVRTKKAATGPFYPARF